MVGGARATGKDGVAVLAALAALHPRGSAPDPERGGHPGSRMFAGLHGS